MFRGSKFVWFVGKLKEGKKMETKKKEKKKKKKENHLSRVDWVNPFLLIRF